MFIFYWISSEHDVIIGESFRNDRQFDMIRYDFKPKSIDSEKEGILGQDDTACIYILPTQMRLSEDCFPFKIPL